MNEDIWAAFLIAAEKVIRVGVSGLEFCLFDLGVDLGVGGWEFGRGVFARAEATIATNYFTAVLALLRLDTWLLYKNHQWLYSSCCNISICPFPQGTGMRERKGSLIKIS